MDTKTVLETERLVLTRWAPEDIEDVMAIHSDPRVNRYLTPDKPIWSREYAQRKLDVWIADDEKRGFSKWRLSTKNHRLLGRAGFSTYTSVAGELEMGYVLMPSAWGKGYATEIATALRNWIFADLKVNYFLAFAHVNNLASCRVLEKTGMTATHVEEAHGMMCRFFRSDRPVG